MNGLVLGRFMPLHTGHCYLIDFALSFCKYLHICICSRHDDPIAGNIRYEWIRQQFPQALVHHITKEIPEANVTNPNAPKIWAKEIKTHIMADIQYFFASENYGWEFSQYMNAKFIPLDFTRNNINISASKIRLAPLKYWNYLSTPVKCYAMKLIGIHGNTEYAQQLAQVFNTKIVYPYPMSNVSLSHSTLSKEEQKMIVNAEITAMHNFGHPFLFMILDTNNSKKNTQKIESERCNKIFTLTSEETYMQAYHYCNTLLNSTWNELFI